MQDPDGLQARGAIDDACRCTVQTRGGLPVFRVSTFDLRIRDTVQLARHNKQFIHSSNGMNESQSRRPRIRLERLNVVGTLNAPSIQ